MRIVCAAFAVGLAVSLMSGAANAAYIVNFQQVGNDVVATGSGSLNISGLTSSTFFDAAQVDASSGNLLLGPATATTGMVYFGIVTGSDVFGTGSLKYADIGSGNFAGILVTDNQLGVPVGYVSGSDLGVSTDSWTNASFSSLGLTPGTYVYSYSPEFTAENEARLASDTIEGLDTFTINIPAVSAVPLPASAPMFGAALLALAAVGYGMKRKQAQA